MFWLPLPPAAELDSELVGALAVELTSLRRAGAASSAAQPRAPARAGSGSRVGGFVQQRPLLGLETTLEKQKTTKKNKKRENHTKTSTLLYVPGELIQLS